jgi:hypothetical protein
MARFRKEVGGVSLGILPGAGSAVVALLTLAAVARGRWLRATLVSGPLALLILVTPGPARAGDGSLCFVCPPVDLAGRPLQSSNTSTDLFCQYQIVPNDFFCRYFLDTGLLKQDHDNGFCPATASTAECGPTPTATATVTATPTNTPVPAGGSCMTTSQCARPLVCIDDVCTSATAPAPTMSKTGLMIALGLLIGLGAVTILRRRVL